MNPDIDSYEKEEDRAGVVEVPLYPAGVAPLQVADAVPGVASENTVLRVTVHLLCCLVMGGFALVSKVSPPPERGFFCDDESIRYPYLPETVPASLALVILLGVPLVVVLAVESVYHLALQPHFARATAKGRGAAAEEQDEQGEDASSCSRCYVPPIINTLYVVLGGYAFAMLASMGLASLCKITFGRLRPHFLAVCDPDWANISCKDATGNVLVKQYTCLGENENRIHEARLSFFSAHSSNSMAAFGYLILYLQYRVASDAVLNRLCRGAATFGQVADAEDVSSAKGAAASRADATRTPWYWDLLRACCPFFQIGCFLLAIFIAFSRLIDFFHHPSDVVTGIIVGVLFAWAAARHVAQLQVL